MSRMRRIQESFVRPEIPHFDVGDMVDVHVLIKEGDKERIQVFNGTVIRKRGGTGLDATYTVRRIVHSEGVERTFPLHSPSVQMVEVKRSGRTRRARLYFLRDRTGKSTRLKEIIGKRRRAPKGRKGAEEEPVVDEAAVVDAPTLQEAPEAEAVQAEARE